MEALKTTALAVGALSLASTAYNVLGFIRLHTRRGNVTKYLDPTQETWAIVTGASDGFGFALAQELASLGFNIILHSRSADKLAAKRQALLSSAPPDAKVEIVAADASLDPLGGADKILAAAEGKHVAVLVNNLAMASVTQDTFRAFEATTAEEIERCANMNVVFHTRVFSAVMARFRAWGSGGGGGGGGGSGGGLVMSIGSLGGVMGMPYLGVYCALKAYQRILAMSLAFEARAVGGGVEVLCVELGETVTAGNPGEESLMMPSASKVARAALDKVGCGKREVCAFWGHGLVMSLSGWIVSWFGDGAVEGSLEASMKSYMEKQERAKKAQ
ncbi:NAD(P)-binding protein [Corynespora cassiicola Philippines]|uniref:NAD(P)-binding protein n=1 Tax=Corynespora cassiicola Philippines TaxID=1448308 RepID=A0A2T2NSC9_CORCC|nr:NAD(P)-binding protein [Corynespora cassiicola Philippines]